ncbi:MAG: hypothetical protein ACTMUB_08915 [cyanobacterium endosymbiont of Rhopalodia musculus]|uniref:hypothetical protein n=1 Tax=cyanobacterium endosymbiont of Epithemia clementina EcSB TaxID=3034674 RepID=UPI00247FA61B|nr:hypothetical protein [cyanobacterium endosymbiont of Epithemia clementina EcSB]WGT68180.1 hypothetical protein P3F56_03695 [cyanobacterium endosymbiont of Epithemia clementina EcSB]
MFRATYFIKKETAILGYSSIQTVTYRSKILLEFHVETKSLLPQNWRLELDNTS